MPCVLRQRVFTSCVSLFSGTPDDFWHACRPSESRLCSAGLEIRFNYSCSLLRLLPICQHGGLDFDVFFLSQLLVFANLLRAADEVLVVSCCW